MSGWCEGCTSPKPPPRMVVVAEYEVYGSTHQQCVDEAHRLAAMTGLTEGLKVDIGPLRIEDRFVGGDSLLGVTWVADAIVRMEVSGG